MSTLFDHTLQSRNRIDAAAFTTIVAHLEAHGAHDTIAVAAGRADLPTRTRRHLIAAHWDEPDVRAKLLARTDLDNRDAEQITDTTADQLIEIAAVAASGAVLDAAAGHLRSAGRTRIRLCDAMLANTHLDGHAAAAAIDAACKSHRRDELLATWTGTSRRYGTPPAGANAVFEHGEHWRDALRVVAAGWYDWTPQAIHTIIGRLGGNEAARDTLSNDNTLDGYLCRIADGLSSDAGTCDTLRPIVDEFAGYRFVGPIQSRLHAGPQTKVDSAALATTIRRTNDPDIIARVAEIVNTQACDEARISAAALRNPAVTGAELRVFARWAPAVAARRAARSHDVREVADMLPTELHWDKVNLRVDIGELVDEVRRRNEVRTSADALVELPELPLELLCELPVAYSTRLGTGAAATLIDALDANPARLAIFDTLISGEHELGTTIGSMLELAELLDTAGTTPH